MSYQVLARKWRPKNFEDVVGQTHITRSLQNSLKEGTVGHAYIFSGTRGIGKTSVARIFAKALRCEVRAEGENPCGSCESCSDFETASSMNVIEIDGASNNSVDNIRDLVSNIQYLPSSGKYKIYIIDEVHMLSTSAFNALLKTLEEPPEHAIFMLATTEPEKLLGTVLSRCQRFDFRNATVEDLSSHIEKISSVEGIEFESKSLIKKLSTLGNGSFRDTLSLLDQVLSFSIDKNVTDETFSRALGVVKTEAVSKIITSIITGDAESLSQTYREAMALNASVQNIAMSILESVFSVTMSKDIGNHQRVAELISKEVFDNVSSAELYWLYEVLSQDFTWSLESLMPTDATEMVLRKVTLRNSFIENHAPIGTVQKKSEEVETSEIPEPVAPIKSEEREVVEQEPEEVVQERPPIDFSEISQTLDNPAVVEVNSDEEESAELEVKAPVPEGEKTWEGFCEYLFSLSPASASNLEQGNLLSEMQLMDDSVVIDLGFPESAKVFFDYLNQPESFDKLKSNISLYFDVNQDNISLNLTLVEREKAEEKNFKSKAEIKVAEDQELKRQKKEEISTDPLIKHAESIFNSEVDKIHLNEK